MNTAAPSEVPYQSSEILSELNQWDTEELNLFECPAQYPDDWIPSGGTGGWIIAHKRLLWDQGVYVRWNCESKAYEIASDERNSNPICGCQ